MSRFTNIYDVLTAKTHELTLGEASHWLLAAKQAVIKIPASSRSKQQSDLLNELLRIHKDLSVELKGKLAEQADENHNLVQWASGGGEYTDDPIESHDQTASTSNKKGQVSSVISSIKNWWTELSAGETDEQARSNATWESVVNGEKVPKALSVRMEGCKAALRGSVAAGYSR